MRVEAKHPETGASIKIELPDDQYDQLDALQKERTTRENLSGYIDNLDISADAKRIMSMILDTTLRVGEKIIRVGQRIIELVIYISRQFPNTTFGLVIGLLLGVLVGSIPLIGALLGSIVMPLAAAFGLAAGYMQDIRDKDLMAKISEASSVFEPLKG